VKRRHATGYKRRSVWLAHRRGDVKAIELCALGRDGVNIGRLQNRVTGAAKMIRSVLVGDDKKKIRTVSHCLSLH